jgi:phage-related protein
MLKPQEADKPLVWLSGEVKSPPFSKAARLETGFLLRRLQRGERLEPPHSKSMSGVGRRCHEPRMPDQGVTWRIIYRIDADAIVLVEVFAKKTGRTPKPIIENCRRRLKRYDAIAREAG